MELKIDPQREEACKDMTGIYIRVKCGGKYINADIAQLDKESLLFWLKSRGGDNPWAEDVVGIVLGHGHLHKT